MATTGSKTEDLTGQKFGRLLVKARAPNKIYPSGQQATMWICVCDCGQTKTIRSSSLKNGSTQSCGCLHIEKMTKHNQSKTRLYGIWTDMKQRCCNPRNKFFADYGGRGIAVCEEWEKNFDNFAHWAMTNGYRSTLTIERRDVNGNYSPANCTWATQKQQQRNKRNNRLIEYNGATHTVVEWAEILGINKVTLSGRLNAHGWSVEDALSRTLQQGRKP